MSLAWGNPWFPHDPFLSNACAPQTLLELPPSRKRMNDPLAVRGSRRAKPGSAGDCYLSLT
jgi:hypothetical protein